MGLHMDDLHTPTVPSGPTSSAQPSKNGDDDKRSLLDLMADKDRLEEELKALMSVLESVCSPSPSHSHLPTSSPFQLSISSIYYYRTTRLTCTPSQHNVNMSTPLTTFDGFPRPDIDVTQST